MTIQFGTRLRNAQADVFESTIGATPIVEIRTGAQPANCAAAASGTLLAQFALPSDWLTAASNGVKTLSGTWSGTALSGGDAGYFRIYDAASPSECHVQGSVTATGGGGDMTMSSVTLTQGQTFQVDTFSYTRGNA